MMKYFRLTQIEQDRAKRFVKRHRSHSDSIIYLFTTMDGREDMLKRVKCPKCNKSENITEF